MVVLVLTSAPTSHKMPITAVPWAPPEKRALRCSCHCVFRYILGPEGMERAVEATLEVVAQRLPFFLYERKTCGGPVDNLTRAISAVSTQTEDRWLETPSRRCCEPLRTAT